MDRPTDTQRDASGSRYVGRFAPSPSGALHFGSLIAAVGSYLQSQVAKGAWRLRIEDIDAPRTIAGATEDIIRTLDAFGFQWSGPIEYQSQRTERYAEALQQLTDAGLTYRCRCSRAQIAANQPQDVDAEELRYPGTCRHLHLTAEAAIRFVAPVESISFVDLVQGLVSQNVANAVGDFVVRRRDGYFTYQFAVVVDDHDQAITEVVRGADLLLSTPRQIALQQALGFQTPSYCHLPLAVDLNGRKLSKSAQSIAIRAEFANACLWSALQFLGQTPPIDLKLAPVTRIWEWAIGNWTLSPIEGVLRLPAPEAT